jgi:predicted nucleic acid-binding protein
MTVISNTSPITNLAGIGQLDLLRQLYGTVTIPQAVYQEMVGLGTTVPGTLEVQTLPWIIVQPVTDLNQVKTFRTILDQGEAEAIVLAMELNAELLIIDERPGRAIAAEYGLKITGVLGVLLEAKRQGIIVSVKPLMDQLINQVEFWIDKQLYKIVLQIASEN